MKLITISGADRESFLRYPAIIDAGSTAELSFQVGGVIAEVTVSDAEDIKQGDLIARLEPADFENSLRSARASFKNADEEYQRAVRLAEQDAIATNVLNQRKTQRDVNEAQLDSAEKALADSVLRAPFNGVIASVPARKDQTVSAGSQIATVINVDTLKASINLPASIIAQVPTREDRGAVVLLEAAPGMEIPAVFKEADLVADATSQTYAITFTFDAPDNMLVLPGMNATVVLNASSGDAEDGSVSIPLAAIQSDGDGQYAWVVDEATMSVSRRDLVVAPGIGENVVISSGLSTGDQIVGAGGAYLSDGVVVTPWNQ